MQNGLKNAFFMRIISCTEQGIPVPLTHTLLDTVYEYGFYTRSCDPKQPITVPHVAAQKRWNHIHIRIRIHGPYTYA